MRVAFTSYWPLLWLVFVPFLWWLRSYSRRLSPRSRVDRGSLLRSLILCLLTLSMTRPILERSTADVSIVYAIDVSRSISVSSLASTAAWIERSLKLVNPSHTAFLVFAGKVLDIDSAQEIVSTASSPGIDAALDLNATDLKSVLEAASLRFQPAHLKRLVLFSDGRETSGELAGVVGRLQRENIRVFCKPSSTSEDVLSLSSIETPREVRLQEPFEVRVGVSTMAPLRATLEVRSSSGPSSTRTVDLPGGLTWLTNSMSLSKTGFSIIEAEIHGEGDDFAENNDYSTSVWVSDPARIIYVEGQAASSSYLDGALTQQGLEIERMTAPGLPQNVELLRKYDAVILSDVPFENLNSKSLMALESYVREGGGFILAAGENTYGSAGYSDSLVERMLPVRFQSRDNPRELALVLALDKSRSMEGEKIELAKEAAKAVLDELSERDSFGLITFDSEPYWTIPLQRISRKSALKEQIAEVQASAHTEIYPALREAYLKLKKSEADFKHVILLSDGNSYPENYERLVRHMDDDGITVSTVAVGAEADRDLLKNLAGWGRGRAYLASDAKSVPRIFIDETREALRRTFKETPFRPHPGKAFKLFEGLDWEKVPALLGYAETQARQGSEVLMEAANGDPLLARWHYGLGRTAIFTSGLKNRWAADWVRWSGYGKFWAQFVRSVARPADRERTQFELEAEADGILISLSALDDENHFRNGLQPEAIVHGPSGDRQVLRLNQQAPGLYRSFFPAATTGRESYLVQLTGPDIETRTRALLSPYPAEYHFYPADRPLLEAISDRTGGVFDPSVEELFRTQDEGAFSTLPLWPGLVALSLLLYLLDVGLRRLRWFSAGKDATMG